MAYAWNLFTSGSFVEKEELKFRSKFVSNSSKLKDTEVINKYIQFAPKA